MNRIVIPHYLDEDDELQSRAQVPKSAGMKAEDGATRFNRVSPVQAARGMEILRAWSLAAWQRSGERVENNLFPLARQRLLR